MRLDSKLPNEVELDATICRHRSDPDAVRIMGVVLRVVWRGDESLGHYVRQGQRASACNLDLGKGPVESSRRDSVWVGDELEGQIVAWGLRNRGLLAATVTAKQRRRQAFAVVHL